ncbi:MAG TPA: PAS domain-containing protein, partial [Crenalkalicoccus sp.]|nr:PAS domain-containing protein [Crenalkalicoccus sp.]
MPEDAAARSSRTGPFDLPLIAGLEGELARCRAALAAAEAEKLGLLRALVAARRGAAGEAEQAELSESLTLLNEELRASNEELQAGEARFRAMADNIPQLAWMARPDGWIFWYNRRWYDYTGTTPAEMAGDGWTAVLHPDHLGGVVNAWRGALAAGHPWEYTFPLRAADGSWRWFLTRANPVRDAAGAITLWFGTNTDITDRLETEAALREREAELARVQRIGRIGGFEIDLRAGGFRNRRSPEYLRLHSLPAAASREPHAAWVERLHPADRARAERHFLEAVNGTARDYAAEYRIVLPDGRVRWIAASGEIERDAEGRPVRMVGAHQDVTERKADAARQELLAREVDHRAKNVLAVVQSVLRMTRAPDQAAFVRAVEGRVAALARAHSLLAEQRWDRAALRTLVEDELAGHGAERVALLGPPLDLAPAAVQPLAMALH